MLDLSFPFRVCLAKRVTLIHIQCILLHLLRVFAIMIIEPCFYVIVYI